MTYPLHSLRKLDLLSDGYSTGTIWETHSLVDEHGGHLCDNESWMSAYDYGIFKDAAIKDIQMVYGFSDDLCLQMYNEGMLVVNLDAASVWINYGDEDSSLRKKAIINNISPVLDAHYHNQDFIEYSVRANIFIDEDEYCDEEVDEEQWEWTKGQIVLHHAVDAFNRQYNADIDYNDVVKIQESSFLSLYSIFVRR